MSEASSIVARRRPGTAAKLSAGIVIGALSYQVATALPSVLSPKCANHFAGPRSPK
jgi:hypothetical protein